MKMPGRIEKVATATMATMTMTAPRGVAMTSHQTLSLQVMLRFHRLNLLLHRTHSQSLNDDVDTESVCGYACDRKNDSRDGLSVPYNKVPPAYHQRGRVCHLSVKCGAQATGPALQPQAQLSSYPHE